MIIGCLYYCNVNGWNTWLMTWFHYGYHLWQPCHRWWDFLGMGAIMFNKQPHTNRISGEKDIVICKTKWWIYYLTFVVELYKWRMYYIQLCGKSSNEKHLFQDILNSNFPFLLGHSFCRKSLVLNYTRRLDISGSWLILACQHVDCILS